MVQKISPSGHDANAKQSWIERPYGLTTRLSGSRFKKHLLPPYHEKQYCLQTWGLQQPEKANMNETFDLQAHEHIALCDLLKITGATESGGQAKAMISDGLVWRNGEVETRKTAKIKDGEVITMPDYDVTIRVTKTGLA